MDTAANNTPDMPHSTNAGLLGQGRRSGMATGETI
jgi:hypothetical protein